MGLDKALDEAKVSSRRSYDLALNRVFLGFKRS